MTTTSNPNRSSQPSVSRTPSSDDGACAASSDGSRKPKTLRLALAGGGTGGHLLPGIHVLDSALASSEVKLQDILWFSSGRPVEEAVFGPFGKRLEALEDSPKLARVALDLEGGRGGAPARLALGMRSLPAVRRARAALVTSGSDVLLGLGGFTTLPAVLAARSLGIPTVLLEINAKAGAATRWLTPLSARIFHAWRGTMPRAKNPGSDPKHLWTGPPLSPAFREVSTDRRAAKRGLGLDPDRPLLAVLGGSQGAGALNQFVGMHRAFFLQADCQIVHQVGPGRRSEAAAEEGDGYYPREFVEDVAALLKAADLVLARGGASTLAEIAACRVPAVIVPYPHHADAHQEFNARELGSGVRLAPETSLSENSAAEILRLLGPSGKVERARMSAELAERLPEPDAAGRILDELLRLSRRRSSRGLSQPSSS